MGGAPSRCSSIGRGRRASFRRCERASSLVPSTTSLETARLLLRPPAPEDALAMFERYTSDSEVTRYLGWARHDSVADTEAFVSFSQSEWERSLSLIHISEPTRL